MNHEKVEYINRKIEPITESGCWIWEGRTDFGYGTAWFKQKRTKAHRFVFEVLKGPIPKGLQLDHLCRVRCCVNPDHMEPVSHRTNILRGIGHTAVNHKKIYCKRGHRLEGYNVMHIHAGNSILRSCRICSVSRTKQYRLAKKENKDAK